MRAAKMDVDLLKHEIEINRLRKQIMSRKMVPSIVTFPPLVKVNCNKQIHMINLYKAFDCIYIKFYSYY